MAEEEFRVVFTERAWIDLEDIVDYWTDRDEPERGIQYAHDLPEKAIRTLSVPSAARAGRYLRQSAYPDVQELALFNRALDGETIRKLFQDLTRLGEARSFIQRQFLFAWRLNLSCLF